MKNWISAFRLKTLPLALSNTIIGSCLAAADDKFRWSVFGLAALTTILLQIMSNMANDYGDFVNGKDTAERIGPKRMVQSGEITAKTMLRGIIVIGILCVVSGVSLILIGTEGMDITNLLIFVILGLAAIAAAIKYTVGKNPYGYRGLGDIFVFIFFGLVGVIGTYFLHTQSFRWDLLLPASAIGFLSTGVLNMNNMRDYDADKNAGKTTIVVTMGVKKAAYYHLFLVAGAALLTVIYTFLNYHSLWQWLFVLSFPLLFLNLKKVFTYKSALELYPELPRLSMASLLFALTFGIGLLI
ncbi:1,4-dihydroxy-2-naphthoate polyprenyltransferase [Flavobacterium sp. UBA6031]|uniref:1,4-dihydroxy-2-naphthoate polyprenyltransferase n=1 Tax=Flavobacterium sp. UBA6031 TaxID=1946551 RepID=UPI0025BDAE9D|nr:1,4-dihydroxy-2-naphthoate polyprenyltransferase [Flavobacterium sp. UBA6031]